MRKAKLILGLSAALGAAIVALSFFWRLDTPEPFPSGQTPSPTPLPATNAALEEVGEADPATLAEWLAHWEETADPALLPLGIRLAGRRGEYMRELMLSDPDAVFNAAMGLAAYHRLPPQIQELVEQPFTESAEVEFLAICDLDPNSPESLTKLSFHDGRRTELQTTNAHRTTRGKRGIPVQGVRLDGLSVAREQVFQTLEGEDRAWALKNLSLANASPEYDFLTANQIEAEPVVAIAGGYVFTFSSTETLSSLEGDLKKLDSLPGRDVGSSVLMAYVGNQDRLPFPIDEISHQQLQLSQLAALDTKEYLIIRVDFADIPGAAVEAEELEQRVSHSVASSLETFSYGKTTVNVSVTESVYHLAPSANYLDDEDLLYDDAIAAYIADGNPDPRDSFAYIAVNFPFINSLGWAGLAAIEGQRQWLNGNVPAKTILHELGHNYGLMHANYWEFDATHDLSSNPVDPTGTNREYGDIYDVMGEGEIPTGHFHVAGKQQLGWIETEQWRDLSSPDDSGIYRVNAFDAADATGLLALRIAKSATDDYYWLGLRQLYPGLPHLDRGAYLTWERKSTDSSQHRNLLVDTTPGSSAGKFDAGLDLGRTYADPESNVLITPLAKGYSNGQAYLDVHVGFGPFPSNQLPTGTLSGPPTGAARTPISFSVSAEDPDGDALAYHWNFGDGIIETSAPFIDHTFTVGGVYELELTISDMRGGSATLYQTVEVSDPITTVNTRGEGLTDRDLRALASNGDVIVAGGSSGTFLRSEDGETWTSHSLEYGNINLSIASIQWTGTEFLAVGADHDGALDGWIGVALTSSDGRSWSREYETTHTVGSWGFTSVAVNDDASLAIATGADAKVYLRNAPGDWSAVDLGLTADAWSNSAAVAYGNGYFVLGAYDLVNQPHNALVLRRSVNGIDWEPLEATSGLDASGGFGALRFLGGQFLGSGFNTRLAFSDNIGLSWSSRLHGDEERVNAIAYGNGVYSAHRSGDPTNLELLSLDGRAWTPLMEEPQYAYNDRLFFRDTFVSVGNDGLIHQTDPVASVLTNGYHAWIVEYVDDEAHQGSHANPDKDWASNFLEYALGSDPADPKSVPQPPKVSGDALGNVEISIHRFARTEVSFTLEISTDLAEWSPVPSQIVEDTETLLRLVSNVSYADGMPFFARVKASE